MADERTPATRTDPWSVEGFYDNIAETFHLSHRDWEASIADQGLALDRLFAATLGPGSHRLLDCACGIGTQVLGLAERGHALTGTDISGRAIDRARREAAVRGFDVQLGVADMRSLPFADECFDGVVCADNSVPHLLTRDDLLLAVGEMRRVVRPGGLVLLSTRDYDAIRRDRVPATTPAVTLVDAGKAITFQLWTWHADGERYDLEHFRLLPAGETWTVEHNTTRYWALARSQIDDVMLDAGLVDPRWHEPGDCGYFQPIVAARVPSHA